MPRKIYDLTHTLTATSPTWHGKCGFQHNINQDYENKTNVVSFRVGSLKIDAGIGTHIDAPAHCIAGAKTVHDIPLNQLIVPGIMINVSNKCDENTKITLDDIKTFEAEQGMIPEGAFVIFYTGWDQYWENPLQYRNNLKFPSLHVETADFLVQCRNVTGLGIDTLSPDCADSGYPVHQTLFKANKYIVENIANAKNLPPRGFEVFILPLKATSLTEAPVRLIALEPVDFNASKQRMELLLNLTPSLSAKELQSSKTMQELLFGKTIIATRFYKKELLIEFEDGTRLFVDNIEDDHDISIT